MRKHLSTMLIIVGLLIAVTPFVGRYVAHQRQEALMEAMTAEFLEASPPPVTAEELGDLSQALAWGVESESQEALDVAMDAAVIRVSELDGGDSSQQGNLEEAEDIKAKPEAIGILEIEKIGVKLPVAEGADLATLKFSLGHMPETAALGSVGNAAVAGHRSHSFGTFFNRLDEVAIGDDIVVTTAAGERYTYEVYETKVVTPEDLSVLRSSSKHRVITLITCTPMYTSTHRLIVHGVVKEE